MIHDFFLDFFVSRANAQQSAPLSSLDLSASATVDDVLGTIDLIFTLGSIAFVIVAGILAITGYRSVRDLREDLRNETTRIRDFVESSRAGERNLRTIVSEEVSAAFTPLFDQAVMERTGKNYPELLKTVEEATDKVGEYLEKVNTLPQFDQSAVSIVPDYSAIRIEAQSLRFERVNPVFDSVRAQVPNLPDARIDAAKADEYSRENIKSLSKRQRVRVIFSRAISAAVKNLRGEEDTTEVDIDSLDANIFFNLSAEAAEWQMRDFQSKFAQIAFEIKPNFLYEIRAIDSRLLGSGLSFDLGKCKIGISRHAKTVDIKVRLQEIMHEANDTDRWLVLSNAWNVALKAELYESFLGALESRISAETEDPFTWVDISYADYCCARTHAIRSLPGWRERANDYLERASRKLAVESPYAQWHASTSKGVKELRSRIVAPSGSTDDGNTPAEPSDIEPNPPVT